MSRELRGDELRLRARRDGLAAPGPDDGRPRRLDDLQACVESVVADGVEGDLIEAGAWRGGASILMRATLDALGRRAHGVGGRLLPGLPRPTDAPDDGTLDLSAFDFLAVPLEEVRAQLRALRARARRALRARVLRARRCPSLAGRRWAIVRLDGDTYEATRLALDCALPGPRGRRPPDRRRLRLVRGLPARGRRVPRASTGSPSRSRRSTRPCARWRRESDAPIERRRRRAAAPGAAARGRTERAAGAACPERARARAGARAGDAARAPRRRRGADRRARAAAAQARAEAR